MGQGYGFAGFLGLGHEATFSTLVPRTDFAEILSETITEGIERFERANAVGGFFEPDDVAGLHTVEGDIVFTANAESIGHFLAAGFGVSSTAQIGASDIFLHDFTVRQSDLENRRPLDSYTIEVSRGDVTSAFLYTGMLVSKLGFSLEAGGPLQVTAGLVGRNAAAGSLSTAIFPTSPMDPFTFDTGSITLAGSASTIFKSINIDLDTQLEADPRVEADRDAGAHIKRAGPPMARVTATLAFEDLTDLGRFQEQEDMAITVFMQKANSFSIYFDMPKVRWTSYGPAISGRERITVEAEGRVFYHVGSGAALTVQLTNTTSGYILVDNGLS